MPIWYTGNPGLTIARLMSLMLASLLHGFHADVPWAMQFSRWSEVTSLVGKADMLQLRFSTSLKLQLLVAAFRSWSFASNLSSLILYWILV